MVNLDVGDVAALDMITAMPRRYAAGTDLVHEGDATGSMLIVLEGWMCRYKILPNGSRQIVAFLMPGDACDLHNYLLEEMDHSIQTITLAQVAHVKGVDIEALMYERPNVARAMYIAQLADEGVMRSWIVSMGRRSSVERLAHLICELYIRAHSIGLTTDEHFALPFSQVVLADALGMTPIHINRMLKELRLAGAMTLGRGSVSILDARALAEIAGFNETYLHRRLRSLDMINGLDSESSPTKR